MTRQRCVLAAITGIDGSGKGHVSALVADALEADGLRTAVLHADGWLNLPGVRFGAPGPAEHFYRHAFRFDAMFSELVLPLRDRRSLSLVVDHADETATEFRRRRYAFENVDVIVLEGIFLLKRELRRHYDVSLWVDCTFETALERAVRRAQEGLPPEATAEAYRTIYFPAQRIHFDLDDPRAAASAVLRNDPRLDAGATSPAGPG